LSESLGISKSLVVYMYCSSTLKLLYLQPTHLKFLCLLFRALMNFSASLTVFDAEPGEIVDAEVVLFVSPLARGDLSRGGR
jgi:hypothetical protein